MKLCMLVKVRHIVKSYAKNIYILGSQKQTLDYVYRLCDLVNCVKGALVKNQRRLGDYAYPSAEVLGKSGHGGSFETRLT